MIRELPNFAVGFTSTILLFFACSACEAQDVVPKSPADGSTFSPGQTFLFEIESIEDGGGYKPSGAVILFDDRLGIGTLELVAPDLKYLVSVPETAEGKYSIGFLVIDYPNIGKKAKGRISFFVVRDEPLVAIEAYEPVRSLGFDSLDPSSNTQKISAVGIYSDGTIVQLSEPGTGATFTSLTPGIVSVDSSGVAQGVSPGYGFINIERDGITKTVEIDITDVNNNFLDPVDLTPNVDIRASGFRIDPGNGYATQSITITNTSSDPLPRPNVFVLEDLPDKVALVRTAWTTENITPLGTPYARIDRQAQDTALFLPGTTFVTTITLSNPIGVPISYSPRVYAASNP